MNPTAIAPDVAAEAVAQLPEWPGWLAPVAVELAYDQAADVWLTHLYVRFRWLTPAAWRLVARCLARRTSVAEELFHLAHELDAVLVWRGVAHSPTGRGRYLLARWLGGNL